MDHLSADGTGLNSGNQCVISCVKLSIPSLSLLSFHSSGFIAGPQIIILPMGKEECTYLVTYLGASVWPNCSGSLIAHDSAWTECSAVLLCLAVC